MNAEIFKKGQEVIALLTKKGLKIATAESCTGGMVSSYLTAVSGASQVFELGVTSYSNRIKNHILKVDTTTLEASGAVSHTTAKLMAQNVREIANADIGVSVTGVAGPASQEGHAVGTVFVGLSCKNITESHKLNIKPESRDFVREQAVLETFNLILNRI